LSQSDNYSIQFNNSTQQQQQQQSSSSLSLSIKDRNQQSKDDTSWPFLCVSINFTKECLQLLRRGIFNDRCNKQQSVMIIINDYHKALFNEFIR